MNNSTTYIAGGQEKQHTLVQVFLRGGADALSIVVPHGDDGLYRARPTIGLGAQDLIRLNDMFGLNSALQPLEAFFKNGELSIVHCAGSEDDTHSHFEAQDFMERGGNESAGGWIARFLRARATANVNPLSAVAIGTALPESLRGAPSAVVMENFDAFGFDDTNSAFVNMLRSLYGVETDFLGRAGAATLNAMNQIATLREGEYKPAAGVRYDDDEFSQGLSRIAQLIKSGVGVEAATIDLDGWDSHFTQSTLMEPLMQRLAKGLSAFRNDLGQHMDNTTIVVMSEFGRRVYENASFGTDHGGGGVMFVMGGGIQGGTVRCDWSGIDAALANGPGDLPVQTNYRDVAVAIIKRHWPNTDLASVFPHFASTPVALYA